MKKRLAAIVSNLKASQSGRAYYGRDMAKVIEELCREKGWHCWHDCTSSHGAIALKKEQLRLKL